MNQNLWLLSTLPLPLATHAPLWSRSSPQASKQRAPVLRRIIDATQNAISRSSFNRQSMDVPLPFYDQPEAVTWLKKGSVKEKTSRRGDTVKLTYRIVVDGEEAVNSSMSLRVGQPGPIRELTWALENIPPGSRLCLELTDSNTRKLLPYPLESHVTLDVEVISIN
ncbi:uncharacterized protein EI90DRAFT_664354 [Cantharellus anzutake]|uniref:uncharacterized protein n=1 Tax=Cantharellus anzutake TaxID=1750568 RepID=UPI00190525BB|nr:uncharacterized protein EI90DRAFT_664354 [Cantharellus anzutake]KAF8312427.1 hypothetical protein EI90DRAFT_664354 [Cantharellus anzutake]